MDGSKRVRLFGCIQIVIGAVIELTVGQQQAEQLCLGIIVGRLGRPRKVQ